VALTASARIQRKEEKKEKKKKRKKKKKEREERGMVGSPTVEAAVPWRQHI